MAEKEVTPTIGEYTLHDPPSVGRSVCSRRGRDPFGKPVRVCHLHPIGAFEAKDYIKKAARLCETPHPSVLRFISKVQDPDSLAGYCVIYESYAEDLATFITRRRARGQFLTAAELLWVYRQLVAALAVWYSPGIVHRAICPGNVLISRNGQNQLVFKIGDLDVHDNTHLAPEQLAGQAGDARADMYSLGLILYEIATLSLLTPSNLAAAKAQIRSDLESKESAVRVRYAQVASALEVVLQMIDEDAGRRPVPKNVQIALAAIDLRDFEGTISVADEPIVPAGSGDAIVKTAQQGQRESQYQLSLLLRERGHSAQTVAWCQKAAEQGHVKAQVLCGLSLINAEGCTRDLDKAEGWLRKALERGDQDALVALWPLVFRKGDEAEACTLVARAAEAGHAPSQWSLARMLQLGRGCAKDERQALLWLQKAAKQGNYVANYYLAMAIKNGVGCKADEKAAQEYFRKAIEPLDDAMCVREGKTISVGFHALLPSNLSVVLDSFDLANTRNFSPLSRTSSSYVVRGNLVRNMSTDVVIKAMTEAQISTLLQRWLMLLEVPKHQNLLGFIGVCADFECNDATGAKVSSPLSFVLPYLANGSAADFFAKPGNQGRSTELLLTWALDLAHGLEALHESKLVHREVCAHNLFIDDKRRAVLGGFDQLSLSGDRKERPRLSRNSQKTLRNHVAPEDCAKEVVCHPASDIFAFGVTCCEIANESKIGFYSWSATTGTDESMFDRLSKATSTDYQELVDQLPSWVPQPFKGLIQGCMDFDPAKRPTAIQVVSHLENINKSRTGRPSAPAAATPPISPEFLYDRAMAMIEYNPKAALVLLRHAAGKGFRTAQRQAADMLASGAAVPQNLEEAIRYYRMAALHQGAYESQSQLGRLLESRGEHREAVEWLKKAADGGDVDAQYTLARCFFLNRGVERSITQAEHWLRQATVPSPGPMSKAAINANILLATIFDMNRAHNDATTCLLAATSTGDPTAQLLMALRWRDGFGTNGQDFGRANTWLQQAARGSGCAASLLARLIIELSADNFMKRQQLLSAMVAPWHLSGPFVSPQTPARDYSCRMGAKNVLVSLIDASAQSVRSALETCLTEKSSMLGLALAVDVVDSKSGTHASVPLGSVRLDDRDFMMTAAPMGTGVTTGQTPQMSAAEYLRLAFQHFFGLDVLRNLELAREFLVKASESKLSDPNCQLAKAILSLSNNPLDEKCPLRFFVPGDDFQPPFVELETTVYRVQGRAFRCSIVGRIAVLLAPNGQTDIIALLNRCAHAHPNVIGPIGITAGVRVLSSTGARDTLSIALLYAPVQAAPADRSMIADPITACSRLLPFLVGISEGLAHLHRSHVLHGNVSLPFMLVGQDRLGLLATGPPTCIRATAPESLASNHFSSASDVFHFGLTIAYMLTGGSFEDAWLPQAGEIDPKTRLARLGASAASGYADIRARVPAWVPAPLTDIMMRCLRLDRSQRPGMDAVATELQTLRSTLAHAAASAVGPRPAQFWMHTSHICLELTADVTWLRVGGMFECMYGPRIRDRMRQSYNPSTNRCKTIQGKQTPGVMHSKSFGTTTGPSSVLAYPNLAAGTRKIIEYKARFFASTTLSSWDGSEVLPRGDRHFPSWAKGAMLLEDKKLTAFVNHLDNPPCYQLEKVWCTGAPDKCKCERAARPKNPQIIIGVPPDLLRHMASFLEMTDYGALAGVCKVTWAVCEDNMLYWRNLIKEHGNQGQTYVPLESFTTKKENKNRKDPRKESKMDLLPRKEDKIFDVMIRRWAKIIAIQQIYTRAYTSLQLETTDVLHIPDITREERKHLIDKAYNEYKAKKHACGLCRKPVVFNDHFADQRTKAVGGVFMACTDCLAHNVWSTPEACTLWGFTMKQLEKIPFWRFSTSKRFCTADLLEFRMRKPMLKKHKIPKGAVEGRRRIDADMWNRYPDLPEFVRAFIVADPAHPALRRPIQLPPTTVAAGSAASRVDKENSAQSESMDVDYDATKPTAVAAAAAGATPLASATASQRSAYATLPLPIRTPPPDKITPSSSAPTLTTSQQEPGRKRLRADGHDDESIIIHSRTKQGRQSPQPDSSTASAATAEPDRVDMDHEPSAPPDHKAGSSTTAAASTSTPVVQVSASATSSTALEPQPGRTPPSTRVAPTSVSAIPPAPLPPSASPPAAIEPFSGKYYVQYRPEGQPLLPAKRPPGLATRTRVNPDDGDDSSPRSSSPPPSSWSHMNLTTDDV